MKRYLVLFCLLLLLVPTVSADENGSSAWNMSVHPGFAFNGDNITFEITGIRYEYVQVVIETSSGVYVTDMMARMDPYGAGNVTWNIPIDNPSGKYNASLVSQGVNLTSVQFEVVFDKMTYMAYKVDILTEKTNRQSEMLINYGRQVQQVQDTLSTYAWCVAFTVAIAACLAIYVLWTFKDWLHWVMEMYEGKGRIRNALQFLTHLPPEGYLPPYIEESKNDRERDLEMQNEELRKEEKIFVVTMAGDRILEERRVVQVEKVKDVPEAKENINLPFIRERPKGRIRRSMGAFKRLFRFKAKVLREDADLYHDVEEAEEEPEAAPVRVVERVAKVPAPAPMPAEPISEPVAASRDWAAVDEPAKPPVRPIRPRGRPRVKRPRERKAEEAVGK